jgi:aryl-alcohol dehydrogenase-like predicted oxidoreductase
MFRQRPAGLFFEQVIKKQVGILARVPLASGLLTGKMNKHTTFESDDHRTFNLYGESFDRGETFSGVDYDTGLQAVTDLKAFCPANMTLTQFALRWILMYKAVTTTIPGAKDVFQTEENTLSANLDPLSDDVMEKIKQIYDKYIGKSVHQRW